jgi:excisionase family DNA binding protein
MFPRRHQLTTSAAERTLPQNPTQQQAADFFGVDPKTIRRWIAAGHLTAFRVGPRLIRVDRDSILKLASPIGGTA